MEKNRFFALQRQVVIGERCRNLFDTLVDYVFPDGVDGKMNNGQFFEGLKQVILDEQAAREELMKVSLEAQEQRVRDEMIRDNTYYRNPSVEDKSYYPDGMPSSYFEDSTNPDDFIETQENIDPVSVSN